MFFLQNGAFIGQLPTKDDKIFSFLKKNPNPPLENQNPPPKKLLDPPLMEVKYFGHFIKNSTNKRWIKDWKPNLKLWKKQSFLQFQVLSFIGMFYFSASFLIIDF